MHYYKRNLGDYAKKCGRLSMLQHGAYTLLIDSCYDREKFPTLEEAIEWTWASTEAEIEAVKFVLSRFFKLGDDGQYVQERILAELLDYHAKADVNKRIALERETKRREKSTKRAPNVNEAPPNQEPRTINQEPVTNNQEPLVKTQPRKSASIVKPEDVGQTVWDDFLAIRKAKRAPMTQTALAGIQREADKAGWPLETAIQECVARGWQGFKAEWVATKPVDKSNMSFAERDEQARRKRWEEMTGRKWPTDGFAGETIEAYTLELGHDTSN
jgi:uncharacterized protein YdaU (DUF1376 family)